MLLTLGEAAHSQQDWATQWIQEYRITPVQVTRLGAIENQYSDQITQFSPELRQAERELTELMVTTASATQIREKERQFEALQIQAAQLYFDKSLAIREVLTLEQRLQLDRFRNVEGR
jgi:Spy/CpxP family protein refolding chaperone